MKHLDWLRVRNRNDAAARHVQHAGRKLLGQLMEGLRLGDLFQGVLRRRLADGTQLVARFDGTTPIVEVRGPGKTTEGSTSGGVGIGVWWPRGFVLYPASDLSLRGWGLPVVPATANEIGKPDPGPYDAPNLAPGLDVMRWTEAGPLGQVLLTRIPGAGYPGPVTAPLLAHRRYGLRARQSPPADPGDGDWLAFRMAFDGLTPQRVDQVDGVRAWKRQIFELTNAQRESVGRDPLALPVRGYYDSAQATSEAMAETAVLGHFHAGYAPTYRTTPDRFTHDGGMLTSAALPLTPEEWSSRNAALGGAENLVSHDGSYTVIGTDPNGIDILQLTGTGAISAEYAFEKWMGSEIHRNNIESTVFDVEGQSPVSGCHLSVGYAGGFGTQHFVVREQWIAHGNAQWESEHAEVPILSWHSFNSANLTWETWPIRPVWYTTRTTGGVYVLSAQIAKAGDFVVSVEGSAPVTSMLYTDIADGGATDRRSRTALSPRVFARGRCIGVVPRGGLVLAAAMQKIDGDPDATPPVPATYRLVVLAHQQDEQPGDELANGMTAVLHVWYYDMPHAFGLAANPQCLIRDEYGEEDAEGWPWLAEDSPWSWRDGGTVDVSHAGGGDADLLKYASLWRFDRSGRKAICLRDLGTRADYEAMFLADRAIKPSQEDAPHYTDLAGTVWHSAGHMGHTTGGPKVCALELVFDAPAFDTPPGFGLVIHAPSVGCVKHRLSPTFTPATSSALAANGAWVRPCAADYDASGQAIYAYHVTAFYWLAAEVIVEGGTNTAYFSNWRQGVLFGAYDQVWSDAVAGARWYSALHAQDGVNEWCLPAIVQDVRDRVWATVGRPSPIVDDGPHPFHPDAQPQYPDYLDFSSDSIYRAGTMSSTCDSCGIPDFSVRLWRDGTELANFTAPRTNDLLYDLRLAAWCDAETFNPSAPLDVPVAEPSTFWAGWCPPVANPCLSLWYARRGAEWMASVVYLPQAGAATMLATSGGVFCPPANPGFGGSTGCVNGCGRSLQWGTTLFYNDSTTVADGGGWCGASFATQAQLADLMQIPGANLRALTLGVV